MDNHKIQVCIFVFFLGSQIQSKLLSTGAFEVEINNQLVYSKIETGNMPNLNQLIEIFGRFGLVVQWTVEVLDETTCQTTKNQAQALINGQFKLWCLMASIMSSEVKFKKASRMNLLFFKIDCKP